MKALEDKKARKILNKLIDDVAQNGIITNTVVADLKELRPYTIKEELPLLAKATRLAAEHVEEYGTFAIPIPADEPIDEEDGELEAPEGDAKDSLHYFFCLVRDVDVKGNEEELREYVAALKDY